MGILNVVFFSFFFFFFFFFDMFGTLIIYLSGNKDDCTMKSAYFYHGRVNFLYLRL